MKFLTILVFLINTLIALPGKAQDQSRPPVWSVNTDLMSWAAIERPAFFAGIQYRPIPQIAMDADFGFKLPLYPWGNPPETSGKINYEYSKARFAIIFSPLRGYSGFQRFWMVNFFYHPESYTRFNTWYVKNGATISYDRADIVVKSLGMTVGGGWQFQPVDKFWVQFQMGLGGKKVVTTHSTVNEQPITLGIGNLDFNRDRINGRENRLHVYLALKMGYVILSKKQDHRQKKERPASQDKYDRYRKPVPKI